MITKKKFTAKILERVESGSTYLDAITSLTKELNLEEKAIPALLDEIVKENLEVEARAMRLLKV